VQIKQAICEVCWAQSSAGNSTGPRCTRNSSCAHVTRHTHRNAQASEKHKLLRNGKRISGGSIDAGADVTAAAAAAAVRAEPVAMFEELAGVREEHAVPSCSLSGGSGSKDIQTSFPTSSTAVGSWKMSMTVNHSMGLGTVPRDVPKGQLESQQGQQGKQSQHKHCNVPAKRSIPGHSTYR